MEVKEGVERVFVRLTSFDSFPKRFHSHTNFNRTHPFGRRYLPVHIYTYCSRMARSVEVRVTTWSRWYSVCANPKITAIEWSYPSLVVA
jgi:hypothetical protein